MTRSISPKAEAQADTTIARAVDAAVHTARCAAHLSHEAQLLKSVTADLVDDGVYAAKRALKTVRRVTEGATDLRDRAGYRIKRRPFTFIGIALGIGIQAGLILAWAGARAARRRRDVQPEW